MAPPVEYAGMNEPVVDPPDYDPSTLMHKEPACTLDDVVIDAAAPFRVRQRPPRWGGGDVYTHEFFEPDVALRTGLRALGEDPDRAIALENRVSSALPFYCPVRDRDPMEAPVHP